LYHERWLRENLPDTHPLWSQRVFTNNPHKDVLKEHIIICYGHCPVTGMKASGIPPHIVVSKKVAELDAKVSLLLQEFRSLNENQQNLPNIMGERVAEYLREHFIINNQPLSFADMQACFNEALQQLRAELATVVRIPAAPVAQDGGNHQGQPLAMNWGVWEYRNKTGNNKFIYYLFM